MQDKSAEFPNGNCICPNKNTKVKRQSASVLLSIAIALLPKCPFCAFGYSGVLVMCSGAKIYQHTPGPFYLIPILIAGAVAGSLLLNFKGKRTLLALLPAGLGLFLIARAQMLSGSPAEYYAGAALVLLAVMINGIFRYLLQILQRHFSKKRPVTAQQPIVHNS
jgi:hypothetical protein